MIVLNSLIFATKTFQKNRAFVIAQKLEKEVKNASCILNVGCGPGYLESELKKINPNLEIVGIDSAEQPNYSENLIVGDFENVPLENEYFDIIVISLSLHHLNNPLVALKKAKTLLKDNGVIFILEIAPKTIFLKKALFDTRILCLHRKQSWSEKELIDIVNKSGLAIYKDERVPHQAIILYAKKN